MTTAIRHRQAKARFHLDRVRRHAAMTLDRVIALADHRLRPLRPMAFDGHARFALITVNFSTTAELQMMLATLIEQQRLDRMRSVVVVDNGSRDGGVEFVRCLAARVDQVHAVRHRTRLNHARGLRAGLRQLDRGSNAVGTEPNVVIFCDTDVIFRRPDTLHRLAECFENDGAVLVGEVRGDLETSPEIQASFVAVRRDVIARRDVAPPLYKGSPLAWQQAMIARLGLAVSDFPSNSGGFILHRGRSGVAASARFRPRHHYATVPSHIPHYMGVENGARIWAEVEERVRSTFAEGGDSALIEAVRSAFREAKGHLPD